MWDVLDMKYLNNKNLKLHTLVLLPLVVISAILTKNHNDIYYFICILSGVYGLIYKALYDMHVSKYGKFLTINAKLTLVTMIIIGIPYLIYLLINLKFGV